MTTSERTEEYIKVMQAYMDGKEIESKTKKQSLWVKVEEPTWNFSVYDYRVKPIPTRLEVANEFFEKTFGVKNEFNEGCCLVNNCTPCDECAAHKEGRCEIEKWWNAPCEEQEGER